MYLDANVKNPVSAVGLEQKHQSYTVTAFAVTTLLYLAAGGLFWYLQQRVAVSDEVSRDSRITLHLSAFAPEPLPQKDLQEVEKPRPKPLPKPPVKPPVQEKPKPKSVEKKPIPKTQERPSPPKPRPKPKSKKHSVKKTPAKKHLAGSTVPHHAATKKNRFLAEVRRRIDRNKHYPRIAKRRGMQGAVNIRFTILKNGSVGNIALSGSKLFYASARHAVESAFPVDTKGVPMSLPATVSLTLRYRIGSR